jgi:glutamate-1-semialdehyde 2,1-aminomutase
VNQNAEGRPFPVEDARDPVGTDGRDAGSLRQSFLLPWNDIEALERVLLKYGEEVAMIIMEPINCNGGGCTPLPGYLEKVRELCTRYGIVLCFDEVITGFRVSINCAQGVLGVTPDLATFGKALAGGVPMGAVAGKGEILDLLLKRRVVGAGTFNGYPLGVAASLASLKLLEQDHGAFYSKIDSLQSRLVHGIKNIMEKRGIPVLILETRGVFSCHFINREFAYNVRDLKEADPQMANSFRMRLEDEGILIMWGGRWCISGGLTEEDIEVTLKGVDRAVARLMET